jgi:DnaJ-class molecular chaperone
MFHRQLQARTLTKRIVSQHYRKLALLIHPDRNTGALRDAATAAFKVLSHANERLMDMHGAD